MPETQKLKLIYPAEGQTNWYNIVKTLYERIDEFVYSYHRNFNVIPVFDWGIVSFSNGVLSWTSDLEFWNIMTGTKIRVAGPGSLSVSDLEIVYFEIEDFSGTLTVSFKKTTQLPIAMKNVVFGVRVGDSFYYAYRNLPLKGEPTVTALSLRTDSVKDIYQTTDGGTDWELCGARRIFDRVGDKITFVARVKSSNGTTVSLRFQVRDELSMSVSEVIKSTASTSEVDLNGEVNITGWNSRCSFILEAKGDGTAGSYAVVHSIFAKLT